MGQPQFNGIHLVTTKSEQKDFVMFPYKHYENDEFWVAPLVMDEKKLVDTQKNPFYEDAEISLFLAEKNGEIAGRIAAIENKAYNRFHNKKVAYFGFFECTNDQSVADLLLKVATDWAKNRGLEQIMGPFNPSQMDLVGVLVDGFDKYPAIMMPYTKSYYPKLLENAGFQKEMDLYAYHVDKESVKLERVERAQKILESRIPSLNVRKVNLKDFNNEVALIKDIFNKAWSNNWGFHPVSNAIFAKLGKDLRPVIDTDFAHIAEVDGKAVAFSISLPDFNQALKMLNGKLFPTGLFKLLYYKRNITRLRTALMGVIPEYQGRGIDSIMHKEAIVNGINKGYFEGELGWVLETNQGMRRLAEKLGATTSKTYRVYGKTLT